jgi:hypothetical protein
MMGSHLKSETSLEQLTSLTAGGARIAKEPAAEVTETG